MSQENVEIAARWYEPATSKAELLNAMPRTMAFRHSEVEWTAPEDGTIFRGREGVRQRLEQWLDSFDEYRYGSPSGLSAEEWEAGHRCFAWKAAAATTSH